MERVDQCLAISLGLVDLAPAGYVAPPTEKEEEPQPDLGQWKPDLVEEFSRVQNELVASRARETMLRELYNELCDAALKNK